MSTSSSAMSQGFLAAPLEALAEGFRATIVTRPIEGDLKAILQYHYPVSVQVLTPLNTQTLEQWLAKKKQRLTLDFGTRVRDLYGCVISIRGSGIIFLEETLSQSEQKYTLAHEFAHFLLEHHAPRQYAIEQFGAAIREVLDGERNPTPNERLEMVLRGASLRLFRHLMLRDGEGQPLAIGIHQAEIEADLLALELIAPYRELLGALPLPVRTQQRFHELLMAQYQLPTAISHRYAAQLAAHFGGQLSIRNWFGFSEQEKPSNDD